MISFLALLLFSQICLVLTNQQENTKILSYLGVGESLHIYADFQHHLHLWN